MVSRVREAGLCFDIMKACKMRKTEDRSQPRHGTSGCAWTRKLERVHETDASRGDDRAPERWEKVEEGGLKVGKGGLETRFFPSVWDFFPALPTISRHFPPFPTSIFILWPSGDWIQYGDGRTTETRRHRGEWKRTCCGWSRRHSRAPGKQRGFMRNKVRIVTGCYAKVHESSHRSGP
jgi:hypothetical protein